MPSGGARARSGPPPDPNALRRERPSDAAEWITLPAEGREGPPPYFPLVSPTEREEELWEALWGLPQAVIWERDRQEFEVALYVRYFAIIERQGRGAITLATPLRQAADALGLTIPGMHRNRWKIAGEIPSVDVQVQKVAPKGRARDRLTVVRADGD